MLPEPTATLTSKITDHIYIASVNCLADERFCSNLNISFVVNTCECIVSLKTDLIEKQISDMELMKSEYPSVVRKLSDVTSAMHQYIQNNQKVLIVCIAGRNVSPLVAGYYMIKYMKQPTQPVIDALEVSYYNDVQRQAYIDAKPAKGPRILTDTDKRLKCLTNLSFRAILTQT